MITNFKQLDLSKRYTYQDYLNWKFDDIVELIKGKVFRMSPAPNMAHQWVSGSLYVIISNFISGSDCKSFTTPFDVRLPNSEDDTIDTVVQPDIAVVCNLNKLDYRGCNGAPDWVIEILSKSTSQKDLIDKFELYQAAGIPEYWIIHPTEETVIPYRLDKNGEYQLVRKTPFVNGETIDVGIFPELKIVLNDIFVKGLNL